MSEPAAIIVVFYACAIFIVVTASVMDAMK